MRSLRRLRITLHIASLAMWFAALAPLLSAALQPAGWADRLDVCSASFGAAAKDAASKASAGTDGSKSLSADLSSCGYCLLAAQLAPPPAVTGMPPSAVSVVVIAAPSVGFSPARPGWVLLPSRAPPAQG